MRARDPPVQSQAGWGARGPAELQLRGGTLPYPNNDLHQLLSRGALSKDKNSSSQLNPLALYLIPFPSQPQYPFWMEVLEPPLAMLGTLPPQFHLNLLIAF